MLEISSALSRFSNPNGRVFRLGGDEFVVLLEIQGDESIAELSSNLYAQSEIALSHPQFSIQKTFSFGATHLSPDEQLSVALKRADGALIQAKKSGKHAYVVVEQNKLLDGLLASSPDHSLSISQIQEAFVSGSVELYLQPVFNTSFNHAVGYEALVRLNQGGHVVSPIVFLDCLLYTSDAADD